MFQTWFKAVQQPFLNIRFNTGKDAYTKIIERPGVWMDDEALLTVSDQLKQLAAKTLPLGDLTYGIFSGQKERLEHSILTIIYRKSDDQPIAFNALAIMEMEINERPLEVVHLGLVMIDPDERQKGFSWILYGLTCFILFLRNKFHPLYISNVTQIPAIVGQVSEAFSEVYPTPGDDSHYSFFQLLIAREILKHHRHVFGVGQDAWFDEEAFVIRNSYTGGSDNLKKTIEETPKHRNDIYNQFCEQHLNYDRGDDFLQLGQLDLAVAKTFIAKSVPKSSLLGVLALAGFVVVHRLFLPIFHWLDASKEYGILRPWQA